MRPNGDPMFRGSQFNSRINGGQTMATENFFDGAAFGYAAISNNVAGNPAGDQAWEIDARNIIPIQLQLTAVARAPIDDRKLALIQTSDGV